MQVTIQNLEFGNGTAKVTFKLKDGGFCVKVVERVDVEAEATFNNPVPAKASYPTKSRVALMKGARQLEEKLTAALKETHALQERLKGDV